MPKLSIEDLKVTYGPIVGTDGVALSLDAGETVALIGANGAGKSSTLKAVLGMAAYTQGSITLDGVSLTVNTAVDDNFSVLIIPHTLQVTTLGNWREGSEINIEVDLMARYAARLTEMK